MKGLKIDENLSYQRVNYVRRFLSRECCPGIIPFVGIPYAESVRGNYKYCTIENYVCIDVL